MKLRIEFFWGVGVPKTFEGKKLLDVLIWEREAWCWGRVAWLWGRVASEERSKNLDEKCLTTVTPGEQET